MSPYVILLLVLLGAATVALLLCCVVLARRLRRAQAVEQQLRAAWGQISSAISNAVDEDTDKALRQLSDVIRSSLDASHVIALMRTREGGLTQVYPETSAEPKTYPPRDEGAGAFFWSERPLSFDPKVFKRWLPDFPLPEGRQHGFFCRLGTRDSRCYLLILRLPGAPEFSHNESQRAQRIVLIANVLLLVHATRKQVAELEQKAEQAREEGMLEISTGVVHNVANAITPVALALQGHAGGDLQGSRECLLYIGRALQGEADPDLPLDAVAAEGLAALERHAESWEFAAKKMQEISELVGLQQRYVGELGTEGVVSMQQIGSEIEQLCRLSVQGHGQELQVTLSTAESVLCDAAKLRFMILRLIKASVDACDATGASGTICLTIDTESLDDQDWARIALHDEAPRDMQAGDALPQDYAAAKELVSKYAGRFSLRTGLAETTVLIHLPLYRTTS